MLSIMSFIFFGRIHLISAFFFFFRDFFFFLGGLLYFNCLATSVQFGTM